ncbi:tetratricopeptide repeat protein, partial [bacterium]|nr:tetratricopeptide repeat protein [bacterium]
IFLKMGDSAKALTFFQNSLEIREKLWKEDPGNADKARDLSVSYNKIGDIYLRMGDSRKALTSFQNDLEIAEKLWKEDHSFAKGMDIVSSHYKLGELLYKTGKKEEGKRYLRKALDILYAYKKEGILDKNPKYLRWIDYFENFEATFMGAECWNTILTGDFAKAKPFCAEAFKLNSSSFEWAVNLGHVYLLTGERQKAREYYKKTLGLIKTEEELITGPVAGFKHFISQGWKPEICKEEMDWMVAEYQKGKTKK